jgi:hypothetical protein
MKKFFSISREQTPIIITLLIVILLGASYLFIYVPNRDDTLQQEHFRWLRQVDVNIQKKIEGCDTLLSHLLELYSENTSRPGTEKYIKNFSQENFTLFYHTDTLKRAFGSSKRTTGDEVKIELPNGKIIYGPKGAQESSKDSIYHIGTIYSMTVYEPLQTFIVSASKCDSNKSYQYTVSMQYTFKNFLQPLLNKWIFDHYVVFSNGHVVYEDDDFPSGISYKSQDSLLIANKGVSVASIVDQKVGGEHYKMFLQPIAFAYNTWILSGLRSSEKYDGKKRNLPWSLSSFLMVVALGLFLFIPVLKIFSLGKNDRLRIYDVIEIVLVVKLLMSLLFFCFFRFKKFDDETDTQTKKVIAQKIASTFTSEVKNAYKSLNDFDRLIRDHPSLQNYFGSLEKDSLMRGNIFDSAFNASGANDIECGTELNSLCNKLSKPELNWMDSTGDMRYNWTPNKFNNPPANYGYRDYFKMLKNGRSYLIDNDTFYLDQLISRTDGSFRTVISKKSNFDSTIVSLGFDLKSLDNVIMPVGYIFAIIRSDGFVLYHSFKNRLLNENLKEEFSNSDDLNDGLQGRYEESFPTTYYEKEYRVRVEPIKGLPYFVVVMGDVSYISSRDIETSSFTAGMVALFILFSLIDIAVVVLVSSRRSYFKNRGIVKTWLWPRSSSHPEYVFNSLANIIMIVLLSSWHWDSYVTYLFILLASIPLTTLFINSVFALKYWNANKVYRNYKLKCLVAAGVMLVVINIVAYRLMEYSFREVLYFELWCLIYYGCLLLLYYYYGIQNFSIQSVNFKFLNSEFVSSYCLMIFTRIIITSGIPVVFFLYSSFNYEQNLIARYRTYDFANKLVRKFPALDIPPSGSEKNDSALVSYKRDFKKAIYTDDAWIKNYCIHDSGIVDTFKKNILSREDSVTGKIFNLFSLYSENLPANNDNFYFSKSADSSFYYNNLFNDVLYNKRDNEAFMGLKSGKFLQVDSQNFAYIFPGFSSFEGRQFWILFFLLITGFYFLLVVVVKKLFATEVVDISSWNSLDEQILRKIQSHGIVFGVGLPGDKKFDDVRKFIEKKLKEDKSNEDLILNRKHNPDKEKKETVCILDFEKIPDHLHDLKDQVKKKRYEYFIIKHFEYGMNDENTNTTKLSFIEDLRLKNKNVLILSTVHPRTFLDSIRSNFSKPDAPNGKDYVDKWKTLLENAPVVFVPLKPDAENCSEKYIPSQLRDTDFLQTVKTSTDNITKDIEGSELEKDLFSIKLQTISYNFYSQIWHSLSHEEKVILYDLAEDGLVNTNDRFTLNILLGKGLIVRKDGLLHVFNKSFRNFILTNIGEEEISAIKKHFRKNSTWSKLRTPLVMIMVAIVVFIFASQEGAFTKTVGYITLLAGSIPVLIQLLSFANRIDGKPGAAK